MRILIVGAGAIGFQLSKRLSHDGYDITVVEVDARRVKRVSDQLDVLLVEGSGTSYRVLKQAGVEHADVVAAMTTCDEVNILACRLAKKAGVAITMARVRNPEFTDPDFVLSPEEMGVDVAIHPEKETAAAVVRLIRQSSANYAIEFEEGKVQIVGVRLDDHSPLLNAPLEEIGRRHGQPPVRIAAIKRKQQTIIPHGKDILVAGDQVFAVCQPSYTERFIELTGQEDIRIDNIMILGGGLIGQFIAAELGGDTRVKIIESSVEKSWKIADNLPDTLVIQGDGTDLDLLATEGILDMDAFVAVTGDDENNIIATLLAQHLGVSRTIALVNRVSYLPITPTIGLDAVVSKQLLTVNAVQRYIRHRQVASIASLPGVDAECIEYIAAAGSKITKKPLKDISFPKNARIGAVTHGQEFIIPTGATHLEPGDRAVVFVMHHALNDVEKLFG